ncbi:MULTISPECIES: hypothetical protein [Empedobacter]|uniref:Uncharacterized protein n=1 Tax=Empedobacter falsenii TaxID=343874 RepID=A0A7H9DSW1_9FLAO|nr:MULTISPECIES: hypothetical protein [Empedobacter]MDH2208634.1 hypothetical protein [Empedobacter sp. GD03644]QLL57819.1 hypothetical protein FH779_06900 [Empedobacter falsenii]
MITLVCFAYIGCVEDENLPLIDSSTDTHSSLMKNSTDSIPTNSTISSKNDPPRDKDPYVKRQDDEENDEVDEN